MSVASFRIRRTSATRLIISPLTSRPTACPTTATSPTTTAKRFASSASGARGGRWAAGYSLHSPISSCALPSTGGPFSRFEYLQPFHSVELWRQREVVQKRVGRGRTVPVATYRHVDNGGSAVSRRVFVKNRAKSSEVAPCE